MAQIKILPDQSYLQECFDYNPNTGILTWKVRPLSHFKSDRFMRKNNTRYAGKQAGNIFSQGYLRIKIACIDYQVHRIIYKLVTGLEPPNELDHENNIRTDNRWSNLRTATVNQNRHNIKTPKHNTTGLKGAHVDVNTGGFASSIKINKVRKFLGYFKTAEEAHAAYCKASTMYHEEFSNHG